MYQLSIIKRISLVLLIQFTILSADYAIMPVPQTTQSNTMPQTHNDKNNQAISAVSVKKFGAIGDGITDDTLAIQNAINDESKIYFPTGKYKISNSIYPKSNTTMISANATIYVTQEYALSSPNPLNPGFLFENSITNVNMLGHWIFEGNSPNSAFKRDTSSPEDTYVQGILIKTNCSNIYIESLEGYNFTGEVFEIGTYNGALPSHHITVDKIKAYDCWNANIAITMGTDIYLKDIETYGCVSNPNYAQIGLDIEPDNGKILKHIQIDRVVAYKNEVGLQVLNDNIEQTGIIVNELISYDNLENGVNLKNAIDFTAKVVNIHDNKGAGLYMDGTFKNISLESGSLFNNQNHGVLAQMDASVIAASSENLNLEIDIYNNHGYGILLSGTEKYPVNKFTCTGNVYDNQSIKTQETGIDVQRNVLGVNITGEVSGNKYYQIRK